MHPHLFHLGPVTITTYGALAAVGLVCALLLAERTARMANLSVEAVWNLCITAIVGTLLISRVVLVAQNLRSFRTYPLLILTLPTVTKFGLLASVLCGLAYAILKRLPLLRLADALAPATILLAAFLHLGDLMAGNDLGATTTSAWGRILPALRGKDAYAIFGTYPVALLAAMLCLAIAAIGFYWLPRETQSGETLGITLLLSSAGRYLLNLLRPEDVISTPVFGLPAEQYLLLCLTLLGGVLLLQRTERTHAV